MRIPKYIWETERIFLKALETGSWKDWNIYSRLVEYEFEDKKTSKTKFKFFEKVYDLYDRGQWEELMDYLHEKTRL